MADFIETSQTRSVGYYGRKLTPDEMAAEFAKCDIEARVTALEQIEAGAPGELSPRDAAQRVTYTRALRNTHERLRAAGR